jgi:hypothetical protein
MPMPKTVLSRLALAVAVPLICLNTPSWAQDAPALVPSGVTPPPVVRGWRLDLEYQHADVFENTVQRPDNINGTRYGVTQFAGATADTGRVSIAAPLSLFRDGDEVRFVHAPFRQSGTGLPTEPLKFEDATFQPGMPLKALLKFDTYRLTYDLPIFADLRASGWDIRAGGTVALRDARIQLSQPMQTRNYTNQGLIPFLLYGSVSKEFAPGWHALAEFDAFPAPGGGGLFDGALKLAYDLTPNVSLTAGYRYEIGGATEKTVYTLLSAGGVVAGLDLRF